MVLNTKQLSLRLEFVQPEKTQKKAQTGIRIQNHLKCCSQNNNILSNENFQPDKQSFKDRKCNARMYRIVLDL